MGLCFDLGPVLEGNGDPGVLGDGPVESAPVDWKTWLEDKNKVRIVITSYDYSFFTFTIFQEEAILWLHYMQR